MLVKIKDNLDKDKWYSGLGGRVIEIDKYQYVCGEKTTELVIKDENTQPTIKIDSWYRSYSYDGVSCKILTNMNKNKRIVPNEKYTYIKSYDFNLLTKKQARLFKIKQLYKK